MQQDYSREEGYEEMMAGRREDKILAAKMAFGAGTGSHRTYPAKSGLEQRTEEQRGERKHRYGLWRFAATVMLFFAFLAGTYFDVSFNGWNKERLEKLLADDTRWKQIVREVSNVMESMPKKSQPKEE